MGIKDWNAGIIRPVPVAPTGPYQDSSAPGVWTLDQVAYWQKQNLWPTAGYVQYPALFSGGSSGGSYVNNISRINMTSLGDATDYGDLTGAATISGGAGSATRALVCGGLISGAGASVNTIQYITYSTSGNAAYFGDMTIVRYYLFCASNSTRSLAAGGFNGPTNVIDYVTIATTGNATDFGDLTRGTGGAGPMASTTRAVFGSGRQTASLPNGTATNIIDYVTIATTGNATDFGDAISPLQDVGGCSNATRGIMAGGTTAQQGAASNVIQYITIATTGNSTDFGDLTVARRFTAGAANTTRAVFGGGSSVSTGYNTIDYITIATTGNAVDFGDMLSTIDGMAAWSNQHGGL